MTSGPVEDHLLVACAIWNGRTDLLVGASDGFDPRAHFEAQLEALRAIGLLDPDAAGGWMRRFDRAAAPAEPLEVDQVLRDRVDRYLESLLPRDGSDDDEAESTLATALHLFEDLNILSEAEVGHWLNRGIPGDFDDDEDEDEEQPIGCRDLRRVVLGPPEDVGGTRVVTLELYDDGIVVRWTALEDDEPALELSDDMGTAYEFHGGGWGSGDGSRVRGETTFTPAVPEGASRLRLALEGRNFDLDLVP